tara:strand:- start:645 stop:809 length:165 start_codon:yes stop_codon:yes gene_type:complete
MTTVIDTKLIEERVTPTVTLIHMVVQGKDIMDENGHTVDISHTHMITGIDTNGT